MKKRWMVLVVSFVGLTSGCGNDHDHNEHDHHLKEEACLHMENGPATVIAGSTDAVSAIATEHDDWEHKRVELSLVEESGSFVGFMQLEIASAGDYSIFVDSDATLEIDGAVPESNRAETECDGISHVNVFELSVGEHTLKVTSTEAVVQLVIEADSEETHHDH